MSKRWTKLGFEEKAAALRSSAREVRVEQLQNGINPGSTKVIPSHKDKVTCPRRQRKTRSWLKDLND